MAGGFWIQKDGELDGPFARDEVVRRFQSGAIGKDLVCAPDSSLWRRAEEFFAAPQAVAALPPPVPSHVIYRVQPQMV
jgi:hypothetical protein